MSTRGRRDARTVLHRRRRRRALVAAINSFLVRDRGLVEFFIDTPTKKKRYDGDIVMRKPAVLFMSRFQVVNAKGRRIALSFR
jgi:hypothetical protein